MKAESVNWKKIIEDFSNSSLSGAKFCQVNNIPRSSFYKFKKVFLGTSKLQNSAVPRPSSPPKELIEMVDLTGQLESPLPEEQATLRITSPSGVVLEVFL